MKKTFEFVAKYHGASVDTDLLIKKAAGVLAVDTGFDLGSGVRDVFCAFATQDEAEAAQAEVAKLQGVTVSAVYVV